jgi:hypothetical protein
LGWYDRHSRLFLGLLDSGLCATLSRSSSALTSTLLQHLSDAPECLSDDLLRIVMLLAARYWSAVDHEPGYLKDRRNPKLIKLLI